jgi:Outer membrane protein beta-barrel domain
MSKRTWLCGTALALILVGPTRPASAEWFLDLYGGGSFTQDVDVTIRNGTTLDDRVKFDTALTGGGRLGYWLTGIGLPWLGAALDVSYFAPDATATAGKASLEVLPISALLMLRVPLFADSVVPTGRVQPYIAGGPSVFVSRVKVDTSVLGERLSAEQAELGADVRAGLTFMLTPHFGVFAEGRYTVFNVDPGSRGTEFDIETFQALGGVTLRF